MSRRIAELIQLQPELIEIGQGVKLALGLGNVLLVTTKVGHVIIDTGPAAQAPCR